LHKIVQVRAKKSEAGAVSGMEGDSSFTEEVHASSNSF
jgi:hypothetical protein